MAFSPIFPRPEEGRLTPAPQPISRKTHMSLKSQMRRRCPAIACCAASTILANAGEVYLSAAKGRNVVLAIVRRPPHTRNGVTVGKE